MIDTDAGHAASVPFSSATNLLFSSRLRRALLKRQRKQFFYRLPFEKQLTLLKRLETINRDSNDEIRKLAAEEGVDAGKLIGWISVKRVLPSTDTVNEASAEKIAMLAEEFELWPELSESRAILLSDLLYITVPVIRELFEEFRTTRSVGALKSPSKYTVASQRLTPEQYKVLAARFKPSATVLREEADQVALEAGLNVFQVCSWLSIHERKMKQVTMQPIVQNLSKGWRSDQLVELERQFRKKVSISRKRAVELSRILAKRVAEVLSWFQNRRLYELYKEHGTCRSVQKKLKYVREILDAKDLDAVAAVINLRKFSPSVTVPRCSVAGDKSASELETTTRNSEDVSVESDATVDLQDQENTPPTQQNPLAVQNTLFEEYKKSSVLDPERRRLLQNRLQIPAYRINAYFSKLSARLAGASESDLKKILTSQPAAFLAKIATEYRRNRYVSVMKSQTLSKQLRASRRVIDNWFSNARLYEQLTGDRSIAGTFREEPAKSATASSESARKLPVPVSQPKEVESCVNSIREPIEKSSLIKAKEQPKNKSIRTVTDNMAARLRQEMDADPVPTEERVVALARKLHLGKHTIRSWIRENTPSKSGCDGTSATETTADEVSTPTVLTVAANETTDELATPTSTEASRAKSSEFPHEIMFYAFKRNPHAFKQPPYDPAFVADITSKTNRPLSLIKDWFVRMNRRLSGLKDDLLRSEYRNANLTENQVRVLEAEFQRRPHESIKYRTALADQLFVTKTDIAEWFMKQRLYTLLRSTLQTDVSRGVSSTVGGSSGDVEVDEAEKRTVRRSGRIAVDAEVESDKTEQISPRRSARKSTDVEVEADETEARTARRSARISVGGEVESDKTEQRPCRRSAAKTVDAQVESDEPEKVIRRSIRTSVAASRSSRSADDVVVLDDSSDEDSDSISPTKLDDSSVQSSVSNVWDRTAASDVSKVSKCCAPYCLCSMLGESCASESSCQPKTVSFGETSIVNTPTGVSPSATNSRSANLASPSNHSDFDVVTDEDLPLQCLVENGQSETSTKSSEVNKKKLALTSHQRQILLNEFDKSPFVSDSKARMLAKDLNVPVKVVELWYRNRRLKIRPMRSPKSKKPEPKADPCADLSEFQLFVLEREYCKDPKLVKTRVHRIAKKLKIKPIPIVAYFEKRASENSN